jgi:hypothetical protein
VWVLSTLREAVRSSAEVPFADELLATRHEATDLLRAEVLSGLDVPVILHADPDPWATGASPGLTSATGADVSGLVVPAWPTDSAPVVDEPDLARAVAKAGATGLAIYHLGMAPSWRLPTITAVVKAARSA